MASKEGKKFNQIEYQDEYNRKNYERLNIRVQKGKKALIQQAAKDAGLSINEFVIQSVFDRIEQHKE